MRMAILCNLPAVEHLEAVALEELRPPSCLKGDHLSINLFYPLAAEMIEIHVHQLAGIGHPLNFGQHVKMEMGTPARSRRNFAPGVAQNPSDEITRGPVIKRILGDSSRKEREIVGKIKQLLPQRTEGAEKVAFDLAILFEDEGGFRFDVGIVTRQVIGKNFAVLENRIDGLAKKTGFTTETTHCIPITGFIGADDHCCGTSQ